MQMKLLDYGRIYPFGPIAGSPRKIAWPANSYRITLPQNDKGNPLVNPFEILILRFLDADPQITEEALSEETCLPQALVHGIIIRLQEHGFLDESRKIVDSKKSQWSESLIVSTENYVTAVVFQELIEGKVLPYIHFISNNTPLKTVAEEDPLKSFKKLFYDDQKTFPPPTPSEILQALREMKNRGRHRGEVYSSPAISQIQVMPHIECYYLACPIAIQKDDGDFRIADPFGNGYSMLLENIFSNLLEKDENLSQWFKNWVNNLGRSFRSDDESKTHYCFDTPELRSKYPDLIQSLRPGQYRSFRSIAKIYSALEWTLFYFCRQFPCDGAIQILKLLDEESSNEKLLEISKKFGFSAKKFSYVKLGKLMDFINGKAEMPTLIAMSLMLADQTEAQIFLLRIAKKFPNFFDKIWEIKESRDSIEHGAKKQFADVKLVDDSFLQETISILLPDIPWDDNPRSSNHSSESAFDVKITARHSILNCFSFSVYNRLGETLQQRLISAEMFWLSNEKQARCENIMPFASDLYAAIQIALRPHLYANLPPETANHDLISFASQKIEGAGFSPLPEYFSHVSLARINMTLQGQDQTLGAATVAFILVSIPEKLIAVARCQPDFFLNIAEICEVRKHGNEIVPETHDELARLKKVAYNTIKTLMEV